MEVIVSLAIGTMTGAGVWLVLRYIPERAPTSKVPFDATGFAGCFTRHIECGVERQDQWAGFADAQTRTHFHTGLFEARNFFEQLGCREHHAVADVALHASAHDAAGDQVQRGFHAIDHQCVACVVTALEADHALRAFCEPVDQLALAFVTPLCADDNNVTTFACVHL